MHAADEVGAFEQHEVLGSINVPSRRAEVLHVIARRASEDENALSCRVRELAFLKLSILQRREKVLQPFVLVGIKLVPEDNRRSSFQYLVANLMKRTDQILGVSELREVEFHRRRLFAQYLD